MVVCFVPPSAQSLHAYMIAHVHPWCSSIGACFLYLHDLEEYQTVSLRMSACQIRAPLKRQHGYILFEGIVFQLSYDHILSDRTSGHDVIACFHCRMSNLYRWVWRRALFISYMVPSNRVVLSPENKPQHVLNAKVKYNDRSLSRRSF